MKRFNKISEIIDSAKELDSGFEGTLSIERFNDYYATKKEAEYVSEKKNKTKAIDYMKQRKLFRD